MLTSRLQSVSVPTTLGVATFEGVQLIGLPGTSMGLQFGSGTYTGTSMQVNLRSCTVGEEQNEFFCQKCPENTYNLNGNLTCLSCPAFATCYGMWALVVFGAKLMFCVA
mgnify:CR=1 FL=1